MGGGVGWRFRFRVANGHGSGGPVSVAGLVCSNGGTQLSRRTKSNQGQVAQLLIRFFQERARGRRSEYAGRANNSARRRVSNSLVFARPFTVSGRVACVIPIQNSSRTCVGDRAHRGMPHPRRGAKPREKGLAIPNPRRADFSPYRQALQRHVA